MDVSDQKTPDGPAAKAEAGPPPAAPDSGERRVWAFLCPSPLCDTELIVFPEQAGQWVQCPTCGLQLRAPTVIPGEGDADLATPPPARRRVGGLSAEERAWVALQQAETGALPRHHTPPPDGPEALARDALAREVARASAGHTETEGPPPEGPPPEVAETADALDALARHTPKAKAPPAPAASLVPPLRFAPDAPPAPMLHAEPVARPVRAARPASAWKASAPEPRRSMSLDLPAPPADVGFYSQPRKGRSNLVTVWVAAVVGSAGVGLLAWLTGLPDLLAGPILFVGVALLWTFFGRKLGDDVPPPRPYG